MPTLAVHPVSNEAPTSEPLKTKGNWTTLTMQSSANGRIHKFLYWVLQYPHADPKAPIIYEVLCTNPPEIVAHRADDVRASETSFDFPSPIRLDLVSGLSLDLAGFSAVLDAAQKRFTFPRCTHIVLSSQLGKIDPSLGSFLKDIRTAGELIHWLYLPNASEISFGDASAVGFSIDYPPVPADIDDMMVGNALTSTLTVPNRVADCRKWLEQLPRLAAVFDPWGREWKLAKSGKGFELAASVSGVDQDCT